MYRAKKTAVLSLAATIILALTAARNSSSSAAGTSSCLGPDKFSDTQLRSLRALMVATDSTQVQFRRRMTLPLVPDSAIPLVTSDSICTAAVAAWHAQGPDFAAFTSLYVIRVGTMYDTVAPSGSEWNQHIVFDSAFNRTAVYLY